MYLEAKELRAIAFDLDGVLWDSTPCHAAAFAEVLSAEGIDDFEYEMFAGRRTGDVIRQVLADAGLNPTDQQVDALARTKTELARRMIKEASPVKPGCAKLLEDLAERYELGLASSGSRGSVELFLEMSGLRSRLKSVLSGDDVRRAKPDAEIYTSTAERLGVEPGRMVVIEDAVSGVKAGIAAGAVVIGIAAGQAQADKLRGAGAIQVVEDLEQIRGLLLEGLSQ